MDLTSTQTTMPAARVRRLEERKAIWHKKLLQAEQQQKAVRTALECSGGDAELVGVLDRIQKRVDAHRNQVGQELDTIIAALMQARTELLAEEGKVQRDVA